MVDSSDLHALYRDASVETLLDVLHFHAEDYSPAARQAARDVLAERGQDPETLLNDLKRRHQAAAAERRASHQAANELASGAYDQLLAQARDIGSCLQCRRQPEQAIVDASLRRRNRLGSVTVGAEELEVYDVVDLPIPLCGLCAGVEQRRETMEFRAHVALFVGGVITTVLFQVVFQPTWAPWWTAGVVMGLCYAIATVYDARRDHLANLHPAAEALQQVGYKPAPRSTPSMTPAGAYRHLIQNDPTSIAAAQAERSLIALGNTDALHAARALEDAPETRPAARRILIALGELSEPNQSCS